MERFRGCARILKENFFESVEFFFLLRTFPLKVLFGIQKCCFNGIAFRTFILECTEIETCETAIACADPPYAIFDQNQLTKERINTEM